MRTNKNCPGYGEDLDAHVENSGMERTSGKLNLHDSSAQPKSTIKKIIPKIAARNAPAEASEKIEKTKTFQLKVKCGLPDKPLEQITAATQSSDKQDEMGNRTISKYSKITVSNKMKPEDFHGEPQKQSSIVIHPPLDIEKQPWRKIIIKQLKVDQVKKEVHDGIQEEHRKIDKMMQSSYEILRKQEKKRFDDAAKRKAEDDKKFWEEENKRGLIREAKERERERPAVESSAWYGPEHCPQTKLHRGGEGQTGWLIPRSGGARLRLPKDGEASHVAKKSRVDDRVYAYGECQKNHAAATGGYALDGCGEFTHGGEQGTIEFLQCGACGCHRNLHRYL